MKFRKHHLEDYINGTEGAKVKALFDDPCCLIGEAGVSKKVSKFLDEILMVPGYGEVYKYNFDAYPIEFTTPTYGSFDEFANDIGGLEFISDMEAKFCLRSVPPLSLRLYAAYPEYAFPYLFPQHFYLLQAICKEYDIDLPRLGKGNVARFNYYLGICRAMHEFRINNGLSPAEMCVFIYGFALRDVKKAIADCDKSPSRIYMVHASRADQEGLLSESLDCETVSAWQGRDCMRLGDIVLMYETAPGSGFGSVWRALSPGFDDPFDMFAGKVFLGNPVRIPFIKFAKLMNDPVWSHKAAVRSHMQGASGCACTVKEYEALKTMILEEDPMFDVGMLPSPPKEAAFDFNELSIEKDVEKKLLEPLLLNLGFKPSDWITQYSVRIGRDNSSRPDYVLGLKESVRGSATAELVFEAKYSIPNRKQREKDQGQVLAYAGILSCRIATLVSKEGIWIYKREDNFDFDKGEEYSWADLENPEVLARLGSLYKSNIVGG